MSGKAKKLDFNHEGFFPFKIDPESIHDEYMVVNDIEFLKLFKENSIQFSDSLVKEMRKVLLTFDEHINGATDRIYDLNLQVPSLGKIIGKRGKAFPHYDITRIHLGDIYRHVLENTNENELKLLLGNMDETDFQYLAESEIIPLVQKMSAGIVNQIAKNIVLDWVNDKLVELEGVNKS